MGMVTDAYASVSIRGIQPRINPHPSNVTSFAHNLGRLLGHFRDFPPRFRDLQASGFEVGTARPAPTRPTDYWDDHIPSGLHFSAQWEVWVSPFPHVGIVPTYRRPTESGERLLIRSPPLPTFSLAGLTSLGLWTLRLASD